MKRTLLLTSMLLFAVTLICAQESLLTVSGGYSFSNLEESDLKTTGWRINGLYEFNPGGGKIAHGFSLGYIGLSASDSTAAQNIEYKTHTWPVYYAPKVMFGNDRIKGFVKGALGMHFSSYERIGGASELKTNDMGFYGGASVGAMVFLKENIFLNSEYEWAYLSNSFYRDGFMNSAMFGIGMRF